MELGSREVRRRIVEKEGDKWNIQRQTRSEFETISSSIASKNLSSRM